MESLEKLSSAEVPNDRYNLTDLIQDSNWVSDEYISPRIPKEPFINDEGFLEFDGKIYNSEIDLMRDCGIQMAEDEKEIKERSIANVAREYGVTFVHAVDPFYVPGENTPLKDSKLSWQERVKIVLEHKPEIACSTVKQGDSVDKRNICAGSGVIIKNGLIKYASSGDATSKVRNGERVISNGRTDLKVNIKEQIKEAITKKYDRFGMGYNEIGIASPEVSAIYLDPTNVSSRGYPAELKEKFAQEVFQTAKKNNLPVYLLYNGEFYKTVEDEVEIEVFYYNDEQEKTTPIINEEVIKDLYNQGIFLKDKHYKENHVYEGLRHYKSKKKCRVLKLGKKLDIYDDKKNN